MFCSKCGAEIADDSAFCPECGVKQKEISPVKEQPSETKKSPPNKKPSNAGKVVAFIVLAALFTAMITMLSGGKSSGKSTPKKYKANPLADVLIINPHAETTPSGRYVNIDGSIKNVSNDRSLQFITLRYEALDKKGNVIDSQNIPIPEEIKPQERKIFSSMAKLNPSMTNFRIVVNDAKYK